MLAGMAVNEGLMITEGAETLPDVWIRFGEEGGDRLRLRH